MSFLDIAIAVIILIGLWRGYCAGFIRTSVSLVGLFIALVAATRLAYLVAPHMASFVESAVLQSALAFLAIVLGVMVILQIIAYFFTRTLDKLNLRLIDRFAGGVIGAAKNILIVLIVFSFTAPFLIETSLWQSSTLAPELLPYAPYAKTFATQMIGDAWEGLNHS